MRQASLAALLTMAACGPPFTGDEAVQAVQAEFDAIDHVGRQGMEIRGKAVWFKAPMFDAQCLISKDLAFPDAPESRPARDRLTPRLSPSYNAQRYWVDSTAKGYCIYMGDTVKVQIGEPVLRDSHYNVPYELEIVTPTDWGACLNVALKERTARVSMPDGGDSLKVEGSFTLFEGACDRPLQGGEVRKGSKPPTVKPPSAPKVADVRAAASRFNKAIAGGDYEEALAATSCWNLFEKQPYGACSAGELVGVGPVGVSASPEHGVPWLENIVLSTDEVGAIVRDRHDPTIFHAKLTNMRKKHKDRSIGVQWVKGEWLLLGVVQKKAESLTKVRYVNDLHRSKTRDVFKRRLAGEAIDYRGESTKLPWEEEEG